MLKQTKRTLDTQLRAEYAHYRADHRHIKYCYECPKSQYITLRGDNKKSLKYNGDKCCLCCLSKDKYYVDIHQPIATATKCPYRDFVDDNHMLDKNYTTGSDRRIARGSDPRVRPEGDSTGGSDPAVVRLRSDPESSVCVVFSSPTKQPKGRERGLL